MAVVDTHDAHDAHGHDDHHDHGEFIAHHFDSPEQQFDSGKLGIWVFLVTEILFFSGLFVAYTLYRSHHPEIFAQAHIFLDKVLGAINTVVLLFSSLTMAWAVRSAQLGKNRMCAIMVLITMVCASIFLGVKAIEYSHKWDMGILVRSAFDYTDAHPEPKTGIGQSLHVSDYLVYLSVIPTILLVGFAGASGTLMAMGKKHAGIFMGCMAITTLGYFAGVLGGHVYMKATEGGMGHASQTVLLHAQEHADDGEHAEGDSHDHETDEHAHDESEHADGGDHAHTGDHEHTGGHGPDPKVVNSVRDIGIFFSIYYCMTGLHAIHILAGIGFLAWILWRSILGHWRSDYFGPVDYVGLYWHLVDLIWIYLFPLLYLID